LLLKSAIFARIYDILGFSLSYELGATNILEMLVGFLLLGEAERAAGKQGSGGEKQLLYPLLILRDRRRHLILNPMPTFFDFIVWVMARNYYRSGSVGRGKLSGVKPRTAVMDLAQIPGVCIARFL